MAKLEKILYFASTHWDREWYMTFDSFRFRLVKVMDEIIQVLEDDPTFSRFILDGQTIMLEDYLEIREENRERISRLIREGRLLVGPWYTMPDEFLVNGESLLRNLQLGFSIARSFGAESFPYGYVCDIFGHAAQLPQILKGCGIKGALVGRGTNRHNVDSHFIWEAPDGSRVMAYKVPEECGYGTFYFEVLKPYFSKKNPDWETLVNEAAAYIKREAERSPLPYVVLMDGMDHERIHPLAPRLARELSERFDCPVEFGGPHLILGELETRTEKMKVIRGELRETARDMVEHNKLIPNTLSSRYDIKQQNDYCQMLLDRRASPLSVMAAQLGKEPPPSYFTLCAKLMAQNQAHDSICGCSIDAVCSEVLHRYNRVQTIAENLIDTSAAVLTPLNDGNTGSEGNDLKLVLFNTEPEPFSSVTEAIINFPPNYAGYSPYLPYESNNLFTIIDSKGTKIPYQILDIKYNCYTAVPDGFYREQRDQYRIALEADIPPLSFREYRVIPSSHPERNTGSLMTGPLEMENSFIRVMVDSEGGLAITDKASGAVYEDLLRYKDYGEIGDGWFHQGPVGNPVMTDRGCPLSIELTREGSEICAITVNKQFAKLLISTKISLSKTSPWADLEITVDNTVKDHKLTLSLATGINSPEYEADGAFVLIKRRAGAKPETAVWKEYDSGAHSMESLVMRRLDKRGLAVFSKGGIHECTAQNDATGTLELTLFRSFGKTFLTNGEEGGQLLGKLNFSLALMPLGLDDSPGKIIKLRNRFINPIFSYSAAIDPQYMPAEAAPLMRLESRNTVLSIIKSAPNGRIILRLVNYGSMAEKALLHWAFPVTEVFAANLLEEQGEPLVLNKKDSGIILEPYEIKCIIIKI